MNFKFWVFIFLLLFSLSTIQANVKTVNIFEQNFIHFGGGVQNDPDSIVERDNGRIIARKSACLNLQGLLK